MPFDPTSTVTARHPETDRTGLVHVLADDGTLEQGAVDPGLSAEDEVGLYRSMVFTRTVGRAMEKLQRQGRVAFHVSSLGEEAAIVGSADALTDDDWIVPCYREIGALFHRGYPLGRYLDMMFGNADDEAAGHQMPEHTSARSHRYASVSAPIGTQITHAVGMAYALRLRRAEEVVAVYFGDGATSSNDFHAAMNMAAVWKTPTIFLCRNNRWAISLPTEEQTAAAHLVDKAIGYGMASVRCDGNDPLAVHVVVRDARRRALEGRGPTFVEMMTYRESGHSTSDDPSVYRTDEEVNAFIGVDPVPRFRRRLEKRIGWDDAREAALKLEIESTLKAAIDVAEKKPMPSLGTIFDHVFEERTPELVRQLAQLRSTPRPGGGR